MPHGDARPGSKAHGKLTGIQCYGRPHAADSGTNACLLSEPRLIPWCKRLEVDWVKAHIHVSRSEERKQSPLWRRRRLPQATARPWPHEASGEATHGEGQGGAGATGSVPSPRGGLCQPAGKEHLARDKGARSAARFPRPPAAPTTSCPDRRASTLAQATRKSQGSPASDGGRVLPRTTATTSEQATSSTTNAGEATEAHWDFATATRPPRGASRSIVRRTKSDQRSALQHSCSPTILVSAHSVPRESGARCPASRAATSNCCNEGEAHK